MDEGYGKSPAFLNAARIRAQDFVAEELISQVERCVEDAKAKLGFDHFEGRSYVGLIQNQTNTTQTHLFIRSHGRGMSGKNGVLTVRQARTAAAALVQSRRLTARAAMRQNTACIADRIATHDVNTQGQVRNAADGRVLFALVNTAGAQDISWSPDDARILVFGPKELTIFNGADGKYEQAFALHGHSLTTHFLDADTLLCGTREGKIYRLDLQAKTQDLVAEGLGDLVQISPDGQYVATDIGGVRRIHRLQSGVVASFFSPVYGPLYVIGAEGHFWSPDFPRGPFWATKGNVAQSLVYVIETARGQETLTPGEFAARFQWRNDPGEVRFK